MNDNFQTLQQALQRSDRWTVLGHSIPDGDCVGAVLGMLLVLGEMGIEATAVIEGGVPSIYRFLAGSEKIGSEKNMPAIFDHLIYVDCTGPERVGELISSKVGKPEFIINIDHHVSNQLFGNVNLVDSEASSTCEILYYSFKSIGIPCGPEIATPLYCGIVMDSGRFQYSMTTPRTLRAAASLLECGVDINQVRINLFESKPVEEIALTTSALNSLQLLENGAIAVMRLAYTDLENAGAVDKHFEGIVDIARSIAGVEVALLFREIKPGLIKVGLRSKGRVDVNAIAQTMGGGGHRQAAGITLEGSLDAVQDQVVAAVRAALQ